MRGNNAYYKRTMVESHFELIAGNQRRVLVKSVAKSFCLIVYLGSAIKGSPENIFLDIMELFCHSKILKYRKNDSR